MLPDAFTSPQREGNSTSTILIYYFIGAEREFYIKKKQNLKEEDIIDNSNK